MRLVQAGESFLQLTRQAIRHDPTRGTRREDSSYDVLSVVVQQSKERPMIFNDFHD